MKIASAHTRRNLWIGVHALAAGAVVLMACSSGEPSSNDAVDSGTLSTVADTVLDELAEQRGQLVDLVGGGDGGAVEHRQQ